MKFSSREVIVAVAPAQLVNMAIVMMASPAFHISNGDIADIATAYHPLVQLLGVGAAGIFLVSLMASAISSSVVGKMAA